MDLNFWCSQPDISFRFSESIMLHCFLSKVQAPIRSIYFRHSLRLQFVRFSATWRSVLKRKRRLYLDIDSPEDPRESPITVPTRMSTQPSHSRKKQKNSVSRINNDATSGKKRGLPKDSPEVRTSKTLSWILRHGAKAEGITMRPDGYVEVQDLVSLLYSLYSGRRCNY